MQEYIICDFCKKAHKKEQIEKIKITYNKCKKCEVSGDNTNILQQAISQPAIISPIAPKPKINTRKLVPPLVGGVFQNPETMQRLGDNTQMVRPQQHKIIKKNNERPNNPKTPKGK